MSKIEILLNQKREMQKQMHILYSQIQLYKTGVKNIKRLIKIEKDQE